VAQGTLWIVVGFSYRGVNHSAGSERFWVPVCMILQGWILVWAFRAIRRGWLEHRDFRALVAMVPQSMGD
jgi:bacteriorhodopsin